MMPAGIMRAHRARSSAAAQAGRTLAITPDTTFTLREQPGELFGETIKRIGVEPFKERVYAAR